MHFCFNALSRENVLMGVLITVFRKFYDAVFREFYDISTLTQTSFVHQCEI